MFECTIIKDHGSASRCSDMGGFVAGWDSIHGLAFYVVPQTVEMTITKQARGNLQMQEIPY